MNDNITNGNALRNLSLNGRAPKRNGNARRGQVAQSPHPATALKAALDAQYSISEPALIEALEYMHTQIDPEAYEARQVPDWAVAKSATFKAPHTLDLPACAPWLSANGESDAKYDGTAKGITTALVFPGTKSTIWHTLGDGADLGASVDISFLPMLVAHSALGRVSPGFISHGLLIDGDSTVPKGLGIIPRLDSTGIPWYELTAGKVGIDLNAWNMFFHFAADPRTITSAAGVFIDIHFKYFNGTSGVVSGELDRSVFLQIAADAAITAFAVRVRDVTGLDYRFSFAMKDTDANRAELIQYSSTAYRVIDMPGLQALDLTMSERTTALSMLTTYMGSDLQNGGQIAWARIPADLTIAAAPDGDYYAFLSRLPYYSGNYALKEGQYCYWLVDSIDEYRFIPYGTARSAILEFTGYLAMSCRRDDPTQALRLQVDQHLEAVTVSITYAATTAPVNEFFEAVLGRAKELPAGSENPLHKGFIGKVWGALRRTVLTPKNFGKVLSGAGKLVSGGKGL